jgi:hypothetical protein
MDRNDQILAFALCASLATIVLVTAASHNGAGTAAEWASALFVAAAIVVSAKIAQWQYGRTRVDELRRADEADDKQLSDLLRLVWQIQIFANGLPSWALLGEAGRIGINDITPDRASVLSWRLYESKILELKDFAMVTVLGDLRARLKRIAALLNEEPHDSPNLGPYSQANRRAAAAIAAEAKRDCDDFIRLAEEYRLRGGPPEPY